MKKAHLPEKSWLILIVWFVAVIAIFSFFMFSQTNQLGVATSSSSLSPTTRINTPQGLIEATPNPCVLNAETNTCDVTVSWSTQGSAKGKVQVWIGGPYWKGLFACDAPNQEITRTTSGGKIPSQGRSFWLYQAKDCTEEGRETLLDFEEVSSLPPEEPPVVIPEQPNIVFIFVDDMGYQLMPYLSKLDTLMADKGTTFDSFIIPHSVCCPTRASVLRGQYAHNHHVTEVTNWFDSAFQSFYERGHEDSTVATWLQGAGYETLLAGKYLNGYPTKFYTPEGVEYAGWNEFADHVPPGWDEWYAGIVSFYDGYDFTINENGNIVQYGGADRIHFSDYIADRAVEFIENSEDPFFLHLTPTAPHTPSTPADRHVNLLPSLTKPQSPAFNEADLSDKPFWVQDRAVSVDAEQETKINGEYRDMVLSMMSVEDLIEDVIEALESTGKLDNTYIFFTSDNGYHQGEHQLPGESNGLWSGGKRTCYEEDIRVPLIVRGPGIPAGVVRSELVSNIDLGPTWAELADISVPSFVDGRSMLNLFEGSTDWRERILLEHINSREFPGMLPTTYGVLTGRYKYLESTTGEQEFYDLQVDPYELESRHDDPAYTAIKTSMAQQLSVMRTCAGQSCRDAEN